MKTLLHYLNEPAPGEPITAGHWIGFALVLAGVLLLALPYLVGGMIKDLARDAGRPC